MKLWSLKKAIPVLSPLDGYNLWASTYANESNPIKNLSNQYVKQLLPDLRGKVILDAGCGSGHFCRHAEHTGASKIVGIDFSPSMIEQARKNCRSSEFHVGDISSFIFDPESFDVIICALVLGHIEDIQEVISNFYRAAKNNGQLIITDFHPVQTQKKARRTFHDPVSGQTMEIRHYCHTLDKIKRTIETGGLTIQKTEEPQWNNTPVIYALIAKKIG